MEAKESPLILKQFDILGSKCDLIPTDNSKINLLLETSKMPVDIDFFMKQNEDDTFFIFAKVSINQGNNPNPGYSVYAEGVGSFTFQPGVSDADKPRYYSSGVNICIGNLRQFVSAITSYYPLGRFSFHSIDMPALLKSKGGEV